MLFIAATYAFVPPSLRPQLCSVCVCVCVDERDAHGTLTEEQVKSLLRARSELSREELEYIKMRNAILEEEAPDVERLRQKNAARWIDGARAVDI